MNLILLERSYMGNLGPDDKPFTEEEQALMSEALVLLSARVQAAPDPCVTLDTVIDWHTQFFQGIPQCSPGKLRNQIGMRSTFGAYPAVAPEEVRTQVVKLFNDIRRSVESVNEHLKTNSMNAGTRSYVVKTSAYFHAEFVRIHPFADGNGRLARLLQDWFLLLFNIPIPVFDDKSEYLDAINYYHDRKDIEPLATLTAKGIYLRQQSATLSTRKVGVQKT